MITTTTTTPPTNTRARIAAVFDTAQVTSWAVIGVGALLMTDAKFADLGYPWIDRTAFGWLAIAIAVLAAFYRWRLQEHPVRWGLFVMLSAVPVAVIGLGFFLNGAGTGFGWMLMICQLTRTITDYHKQLTSFHEALRTGVLLVSPLADSASATSFRRIARGAIHLD